MTEQTFSAIRSHLANRAMDTGYDVRFADANCRCGAAVFRVDVDEEVGEAWFHCTACNTSYSLHDANTHVVDDAYDAVDFVCTCGRDEFEVVAGVTLYGQSDAARTAYIGCRCVACGRIGCYASWPRVDDPYAAFFATMTVPRE